MEVRDFFAETSRRTTSETNLESRKWYFKYFAKIFSLGAPDYDDVMRKTKSCNRIQNNKPGRDGLGVTNISGKTRHAAVNISDPLLSQI